MLHKTYYLQAGFVISIASIFGFALFSFYPIHLIFEEVKYVQKSRVRRIRQFSEVCREVLGGKMAVLSVVVSLFNLLGDMICYWIMMSSLLFELGCYINGKPNLHFDFWLS